jgi:hypothetical protein
MGSTEKLLCYWLYREIYLYIAIMISHYYDSYPVYIPFNLDNGNITFNQLQEGEIYEIATSRYTF